MYKNANPLFLICETPLHVGSGSDLGIVDLPIQRERHTNFPKIEASSLKGALREAFESAFQSDSTYANRLKIHRTFGYDKDGVLKKDEKNIDIFFGEKTQFSGALSLTDARLLLFPVKSLYEVFTWITCPRVINKFISDLKLCGTLPFVYDEKEKFVSNKVTTNSSSLFDKKGHIYLEEFVFTEIENNNSNLSNIASWLSDTMFADLDDYWKNKIKTDIVVLDDIEFRDFVTLSTEVITRTKINNATGTVQDGALFSEEYLPAESVMYSLAMFTDEFRKDKDDEKVPKMKAKKEGNHEGVLEFFESGLVANNNIVQVGANATLGKGIIKTKFVTQSINGKEAKSE